MSNAINQISAAPLPAHIAALHAKLPSNAQLLGGINAGSLLPVLSIRGKEFRIRFKGQEMLLGERHLQVLIVQGRDTMSRRYFASGYKSGATDFPDCHSSDGVRPDSGDNRQAEACNKCPHSVFGSKITEGGKESFACSSYKLLVVLPFFNGVLFEQPCVLQLPVNSVRRNKGYAGQDNFYFEYLSALQSHSYPAGGVVTRLSFTAAEYPQLAFAFSRFASPEEVDRIVQLSASSEVEQVIRGNDAEAAGPIRELATPAVAAILPPPPALPPVLAPSAAPEPAAPTPRRRGPRVPVASATPAAPASAAPASAAPAPTAPSAASAPFELVSPPSETDEAPNPLMDKVRAMLAGLNGSS